LIFNTFAKLNFSDYNGFWGAPYFKALKPFIVHLELGIGNWELGIGNWRLKKLEIKNYE
jgi:hypothetical protein